ncbi:RNA polymerase subunit sigma-70 [Kribbella sancticallisti]
MADDFGSHDLRADDPFRRGLLAHCYRMLGSIHDAETLLQETYRRADKYYCGLDGQTFPRTWLYGLATQACLASIAGPRPLPTGLGSPSNHPEGKLSQRPEVLWLEPVPDALVGGHRNTIGLELIAGLQYLPPQQRAALILHDLNGWPATEVAEVLDTSTTAVASLLVGAREQFEPGPSGVVDHTLPDQLLLLDRYAGAFEQYDVPAIERFFTDDAIWEMPPFTSWFRGAKNIARLISTHCPAEAPGDQYLVPIKANGQPGFAVYMRDPAEGVHRAFQIQVLTLTAAGIIHAVAFFDPTLFDTFALPDLLTTLPESTSDHRARLHLERTHHHDTDA